MTKVKVISWNERSCNNYSVIIPAAGCSSRMGQLKALLPLAGRFDSARINDKSCT